MSTVFLPIRQRLDRIGIMLSGLCAVHCLLGIVLVTVLGLGGEALLSPSIHRVGLALAVMVGVVTLGLGMLRHGRIAPLVIGGCGIALMTAGILVQHGPVEAFLTIAGVALVATAHIRNLRHAN
ncbi:MAG: MerC domain-containing protein [Novosphingobium sp.]